MKSIEKTARTVEEAIDAALKELGVGREETEIEVIERPSKGFFGILGAKPARVRVTVIIDPVRRATDLIQKVAEAMQLTVNITVKEEDQTVFINIEGPDLGILIGRRGETLDALQYLVNLSANKGLDEKKKIILDCEGYRKRREITLQKLALKLAEKAKQKGKNVVLEPMSSHERRIIHMALQGRDDIHTFSEGEEPFRKIIISPKK